MRGRIGLKGERCRNSVLRLAQGIGQGRPRTRNLLVLQSCYAKGQNYQQRRRSQRTNRQTSGPGDKAHIGKDRQREEYRFIGPGEHMNRQPQPQGHTVTNPGRSHQPRQRPKCEAAGSCGQCAAPVSIRPLIQRTEEHDCQGAAQQRPAGRNPRPQHPVAQPTKQRGRRENTGPWCPGQRPAQRQQQTVADGVDGAVARGLEDKKGLKETRKLVRWVCQPPVPKGVGHKQVPKFVVKVGRRYRVMWQQQHTYQYGTRREHGNTPPGSACEASHQRGQPTLPRCKQKNKRHSEGQLQKVRGAKPNRISQRFQRHGIKRSREI